MESFDHKTLSGPPGPDGLYVYLAAHFPSYDVGVMFEAGCYAFSAAQFF